MGFWAILLHEFTTVCSLFCVWILVRKGTSEFNKFNVHQIIFYYYKMFNSRLGCVLPYPSHFTVFNIHTCKVHLCLKACSLIHTMLCLFASNVFDIIHALTLTNERRLVKKYIMDSRWSAFLIYMSMSYAIDVLGFFLYNEISHVISGKYTCDKVKAQWVGLIF